MTTGNMVYLQYFYAFLKSRNATIRQKSYSSDVTKFHTKTTFLYYQRILFINSKSNLTKCPLISDDLKSQFPSQNKCLLKRSQGIIITKSKGVVNRHNSEYYFHQMDHLCTSCRTEAPQIVALNI